MEYNDGITFNRSIKRPVVDTKYKMVPIFHVMVLQPLCCSSPRLQADRRIEGVMS